MKRAISLLLAALLLTGCGSADSADAALDQSIDPVTVISEENISSYDLGNRSCARILPWGTDRYALLTTGGQLLVLSGEDFSLEYSRDLQCTLAPMDPGVAVYQDRLCYFDAQRSAYVILDESLTEISATPIAGEIVARPVMSPDLTTIYYCTDAGIRIMEVSTGTSRLLRQEYEPIAALNGTLLDGAVLHYTRQISPNQAQDCFISTSDGTLCETGGGTSTVLVSTPVTWGSEYAAVTRLNLPMGNSCQLAIGELDEEPLTLTFEADWDAGVLLENGLLFTQSLTQSGLLMEVYDLYSAELIASREMSARREIFPYVQPDGSRLWLWDCNQTCFYCWDFSQNPAAGKQLPEAASKIIIPQQVETKLQTMCSTYGIPIVITENHVGIAGSDYESCMPSQHMKALELLDEAMAKFPAGFFTSMQDSLRIELVDDFSPSVGVRPGTGSMDIGQELRIQVSMCNELQSIFYHELFHAMELHIQSNSSILTGWEDLNPPEFTYEGSTDSYENGLTKNSPYLTPGDNAVTDDYALVSAREDRAQTFMYAMMDGQSLRFQSRVMQNKLDLMGNAIRDAFGWNQQEDPFPWEQYLSQ